MIICKWQELYRPSIFNINRGGNGDNNKSMYTPKYSIRLQNTVPNTVSSLACFYRFPGINASTAS